MKSPRAIVFGIIFLLLIVYYVSTHSGQVSGTLKNITREGISLVKSPLSLNSLVIFNFHTKSDDDLPWGPYCSRIVSNKVAYVPNEILYIPYLGWIFRDLSDIQIMDIKTVVLNLESEKYLARIYSVENILEGTIEKQGDILSFHGQIYNVKKNAFIGNIDETGTLSNPEDFFRNISLKILSTLNVHLSSEAKSYLDEKNTGNADAFQLGMKAFATPNENHKGAATFYQQAIEKDNNFLFAYIGASDRISTFDQQGRMNILKTAVDHFKDNVIAKIYYLFSLDDSKRYGEVIGVCDEILQKSPENLVAMIMSAWGSNQNGDYEGAIRKEKSLLQYYPECWMAHNDYARICLNHSQSARGGGYFNDMDKARAKTFVDNIKIAYKEIRIAQKINPDSSMVLGNKIEIDMENGVGDEEMEKTFTEATSMNPHSLFVFERMRWLYTPGYSNQPEKVKNLLAEGLRLNPDNPDFAMAVLENIYWYGHAGDQGFREERKIFVNDSQTLNLVHDVLTKEMENHPGNQYMIWRAGDIYYDIRDYKEAWQYFEKLPDPPDPVKDNVHEYYLHKAWVAQGVGNTAKMFEYVDKCLGANPCNVCGPHAYTLKGSSLVNQKKFDEGFAQLEKAIQMNTGMAYSYREYAYYAAQYDQNLDKAMVFIRKAIELEPDNAKGYGILGRLCLSKKDKENALKYIDKAIEMDPSDDWYPKVKQKILAL